MFDYKYFHLWLNERSTEILARVDSEQMSEEEILILSLKMQVNHFQNTEIQYREEFKKIAEGFDRFTTILFGGLCVSISLQVLIILKSL